MHRRMDDVLDGVDEQRPFAADVEQALDAQDLAAAGMEQHRQPDPEPEPVDRPVEHEAHGGDVVLVPVTAVRVRRSPDNACD